MAKTLDETRLLQFKKNLSNCVNVKSKVFYNKELILSYSPIKKKIGFITEGKANIVKTDKEGNTTIMRDLKENDIFSNLFFQETEDEIYIISNGETKVIFIDYYNIIKNCNQNCPFHNSIVLTLFDLLIEDNKQQNEKIELHELFSDRERLLNKSCPFTEENLSALKEINRELESLTLLNRKRALDLVRLISEADSCRKSDNWTINAYLFVDGDMGGYRTFR